MSDAFETLSTDLTEHILSQLPIPALLRVSITCKSFRSLITSPTFPDTSASAAAPWFFLYGIHNTSGKNNQSFAYDPCTSSWFRLPPPPSSLENLSASRGLLFSTTSTDSFSFSPILRPLWSSVPPLRFPRRNPLIGVFSSQPASSSPSFVVVGGVRFIGGLVDIEERLAVEIYDSASGSWDLSPPLPPDFPFGYSSQTLSSALHGDRFFVVGIYSFVVSWFDLRARRWGPVLTLSPPGAVFSFLVACEGALVLAGMCAGPHRFVLWTVEEDLRDGMKLREMVVMPQELLYGLVDSEEDDNKFASLKCVGMGKLVYVFNEEYHKRYPACVCDIESGRWWKIPPLPCPVNKFHKVISFCSVVFPRHIFRAGGLL